MSTHTESEQHLLAWILSESISRMSFEYGRPSESRCLGRAFPGTGHLNITCDAVELRDGPASVNAQVSCEVFMLDSGPVC